VSEPPAKTPPSEPAHHHRSDIDVLTLTIAAIASAAAAFVSSRLWQSGTLVTAALTPVIVALVKEALSRPADAMVKGGKQNIKVQHHWKLAAITGLAGFAVFAGVMTVSELIAGRAAGDSDRATTLFGGTRTVVEKHTVTTVTVVPTVTTVTPTTETRTETETKTQTVTTTPRTQTTTPTTARTDSTTPAPAPQSQTTPEVP